MTNRAGDNHAKAMGVVSLSLLAVAGLLLLAGIGSVVSPFYLTGGVVGLLRGDKNINGTGDFTYVLSACFSIVLGIVSCLLSLIAGGIAMGTAIGGAVVSTHSSINTESSRPTQEK